MEEAEAIKMHSMKLKAAQMKKQHEREQYRNMNLERMRLILMFAYQNRMVKPTTDLDTKKFDNPMLTKIAHRH
jgi:hypothetical protein